MSRVFVLAGCFLWGYLATAPSLDAQTTWTGGTGNWNSAANWTAGVPNSTTNAIVDSNAGVNSTVNVTTAESANDLTVDLGDTVNINNGQRLSIDGSLLNNGTVRVNSTGANTYLQPVGTTTFAGNGVVDMSGAFARLCAKHK